MIRFDRVSKRYDGAAALEDVSFEMPRGSALFLCGHSGAGKSTLLKLAAAIEQPDAGSITVNGQDFAALRRRHLPYLRRSIGMIFQENRLLGDRTVLENVQLPLLVSGLPPRESARRAHAALERVGLAGAGAALPALLSGGEQQRVCIARAIVNRPAILLADEPTAHLDAQSARGMFDLFRSFNEAGVTLIIATHHAHLARGFGASALYLDHGRLAGGPEPLRAGERP